MPITTTGRAYTKGKFGLELDGITAGSFDDVSGGHATADVVTEKFGSENRQLKHLSGRKYDDISLSFTGQVGRSFYDWVKASFDLNHQRKNGAIIAADYSMKEVSRLTFYNGLITEFSIPDLNASSKDAMKMKAKIAIEESRFTRGTGASIAGGKYNVNSRQIKRFTPANYRLRIDGLDCTRVSKVGSLSIKQKVVENHAGEQLTAQKEPSALEIGNVSITLPESHGEEFYRWHEDFVIKGLNGDDKEKGGTLELLGHDGVSVLMTVTLQNLGIFKLNTEGVKGGDDGIRNMTAELYCEYMMFDGGNAV